MRLANQRRLQIGVLLGPVTLFLLVFFAIPLGIMVVTSFLAPGLYGGVEWTYYPHNFGRILGFADPAFEEYDPVYIAIFFRSLKIAAVTVVATLLVCYPAAFHISRLPDKWKNFCLFLITLPFFSSLIVRLFVWVMILRPTGLINETLMGTGIIARPLEMIYTDGAIVLGMVYVFIPFMFMPVYASIEKLDFRLIEAAYDLYASRWNVLFRVIVPLVKPGLIAGAILVFIPALSSYVIPRVLGGGKNLMIGNLIELQFGQGRNWPLGASLSVTLVIIVLVAMLYYVKNASKSGGAHG